LSRTRRQRSPPQPSSKPADRLAPVRLNALPRSAGRTTFGSSAQFDSEAEQLGIGQSICVEAASAGSDGRLETEWLLPEIEKSPRVAALVAWAPLEQPYIERYLDWLSSLRGKPVVGVRRGFELEPDDFPKQATVIGARGPCAPNLRPRASTTTTATGRTARSTSRRPIRSSQRSDLSARRDQTMSSFEIGSVD
jgi:hypothetical protein